MQRGLPADAVPFGASDDNRSQAIFGTLLPYPTRAEQTSFDNYLPQFGNSMAASMGITATPRPLRGLDDIGDVRRGATVVKREGGAVTRFDMLAFRRGGVGVILTIGY